MREEITYWKNGKEKTLIVYSKDGIKKSEYTFWKNGKTKTGIFYYEDGAKEGVVTYRNNGKLKSTITYHEDGVTKKEEAKHGKNGIMEVEIKYNYYGNRLIEEDGELKVKLKKRNNK